MNTILEAVKKVAEDFSATTDGLKGRIEQLEVASDRPGNPGAGADQNAVEHKDVFLEWIRDPHNGSTKRRLDDAQQEMIEKKAVTIGTESAGGYALPAIIANQVEERVTTLNPFRQICRVNRVGSSDYAHLVSKNQAGSGWVGEGDSRSETDTSELLERKPTFGTVYAYPKASEESFQDIFFDVEGWLINEISDGFAAAEATAFVTGNGTNKPTGFLNAAPVTTADDASPERTAGTLRYLPMDSSSPQALHADDLYDLAGSFKDGYLFDERSVAWVMRQSTLTVIRKLKDNYGAYLLQPSLQAGTPNMLLGFPVYTTDAMPAYSADNHPIAFGNWNRGYLIADRSNIALTVDDNITTPGQIKFYARKRVGGIVLNDEALRVLKYSDS
tara:strand:- start:3489 stop:4649 length:1161 start_codon:yes stop_codon:yes gene_type:complete